jgi:hypothetical protein
MSGDRGLRRRATFAALAALLALAAPATAGAQVHDPRPIDQRPQREHNPLPPQPQKVIAGTGEVTVSPRFANVGDTITATFSKKPGGEAWSLHGPWAGPQDCQGGTTKLTGEAAKHLPISQVGGVTSCSFKATAGTGRQWAAITASIVGPCGDPTAVHPGGAEFAACASAHADDSYMVFGPGDNVVEGFVRGTQGDPVVGLRVEIKQTALTSVSTPNSIIAGTPGTGGGAVATTGVFDVTDATGHWGFWVDEGDYEIRPSYFDDERFGGVTPADFSPPAAKTHVKGRTTVDFELKGYRISGHVTDSKGKGLANLTVGFRSDTGYREATTGSDGGYTITLPSRKWAVEVITPPPRQPNQQSNVWGAPYQCKAQGAGPDDFFCRVQNDSDKTGINFLYNTDRDLHMSVSDTPDAAGRFKVTVLLRDSRRQPIGNQVIHFTPPLRYTPRALICRTTGQRLWPQSPVDLSSDFIPGGEFDLTTDDQGMIVFYVWPGTQSGQWALDAKIPDSTLTSESASITLNFPSKGSSLPPASDLDARITAALHSAFRSPNRGPDNFADLSPTEALDKIWPALLQQQSTLGASMHPVRTNDGNGAGILFLPPSAGDNDVKSVLGYLRSNGAGARPTVPNFVLDVGNLSLQATAAATLTPGPDPWAGVVVATINVADWPAHVQRDHPTLYTGAALPIPSDGDIRSSDEERAFTYFGWPARPGGYSPVDRCAGVTPRSTVVQTHSPISLDFVDDKGRHLTGPSTAGGQPVVDIHDASITTEPDGETTTYSLPRAKWSFTVTGTGSGAATLVVYVGGGNDSAFVFDLVAAPGATGTAVSDPSGTGNTFTFGGSTVTARNGLNLNVTGLPKAISPGVFETHTVSVTDEFGHKVPDATVAVTGEGYSIASVTGSDGTADLLLLGPQTGKKLQVTVRAPAHNGFGAAIDAGPPAAPPVDAAMRSYIGSDQQVTWVQLAAVSVSGGSSGGGFPWALVIVLLVIVAAAVVVRRQRPQLWAAWMSRLRGVLARLR